VLPLPWVDELGLPGQLFLVSYILISCTPSCRNWKKTPYLQPESKNRLHITAWKEEKRIFLSSSTP